MVHNGGLRRQLVLVWLGIVMGAGALALLELLLLTEHGGLAMGITIVAALATGTLVTRHLVTKCHQPLITVQDLRAR